MREQGRLREPRESVREGNIGKERVREATVVVGMVTVATDK